MLSLDGTLVLSDLVLSALHTMTIVMILAESDPQDPLVHPATEMGMGQNAGTKSVFWCLTI